LPDRGRAKVGHSERPGPRILQCNAMQYEADSTADVRSFVQPMRSVDDELDEVAVLFGYNYYAMLSGGPPRLTELAPMYSDESVSRCAGRHCMCVCVLLLCVCERGGGQESVGRLPI
jgi:hypothetical protein